MITMRTIALLIFSFLFFWAFGVLRWDTSPQHNTCYKGSIHNVGYNKLGHFLLWDWGEVVYQWECDQEVAPGLLSP